MVVTVSICHRDLLAFYRIFTCHHRPCNC